MPAVRSATRAVVQRQTQNPRTVLGFYATVAGLFLSSDVAAIAVLASTDKYVGAIPYLLLAGVVVFLTIVGGVFYLNVKAPPKLMLGQITGREYAQIEQIALGDSLRGERFAPAIEEGPQVLELPAGAPENADDRELDA